MNTQERIEKMLKKSEKILQAGNKNKPEQLKPCPFCGSDKKLHTMALGEKEGEEIHILSCCKCDICGAETDNAFISSGKWKSYSVCDKCAQIKGEELLKLDKDKQFAVIVARVLADDGDDD